MIWQESWEGEDGGGGESARGRRRGRNIILLLWPKKIKEDDLTKTHNRVGGHVVFIFSSPGHAQAGQ